MTKFRVELLFDVDPLLSDSDVADRLIDSCNEKFGPECGVALAIEEVSDEG